MVENCLHFSIISKQDESDDKIAANVIIVYIEIFFVAQFAIFRIGNYF